MSTHTERSAWSPDEADSLENIDKEVQLVSTSTESQSASNKTDENGSVGHRNVISDSTFKAEPASRQSNLSSFYSKSYDNLQAIKFHNSGKDVCCEENKFKFNSHGSRGVSDTESHPYTLLTNQAAKNSHVKDHAQGKGKSNVNNDTAKLKGTQTRNTASENSDKEDYLEQINKQLTKELDEKNAILTLLQENYERLLFKYAEAQNRIDELRIKFLAEKSEPQNFQAKHEILNNHIQPFYNGEYSSNPDTKAVVPPFINLNEPPSPPSIQPAPVNRPSSLPLDNGLKLREKDLLKATTPTDSEGLSSIITSMSGHSKILNSLDEETQINKKSNFFKYKRNNFLLQDNPVSNDPFDKVKNWQNSLPPLEQIETPETTLYNINNAYSSTGTNYKDVSSPKIENDFVFSDESCPPSWREEARTYNGRCETKRSKSSSQNESQFYYKIPQNERERFHESSSPLKEKSPSQSNLPLTCIIQRRQKRPQLLRCSSLPAYDCDSVRSGNYKNGIFIPPLDLNNVTLSDDESYCQQDYYLSKSNAATSSSFISSREESVDRSIQTPQSFSSCKATISEERVPRQTISKSTSITPERTRAMNLSHSNRDRPKFEPSNCKNSGFLKKCKECCTDKTISRCNVCGETISEEKSGRFSGSRSNSCESVHKTDLLLKETMARRSQFKRSVSFGSGTNTPSYFSHEKQTPRDYFSGLNEDSLENFDAYANNLKTRSQVVIKALTAHVNNS